jgi:hypothetical protein
MRRSPDLRSIRVLKGKEVEIQNGFLLDEKESHKEKNHDEENE